MHWVHILSLSYRAEYLGAEIQFFLWELGLWLWGYLLFAGLGTDWSSRGEVAGLLALVRANFLDDKC